jgi:CRISPR-associated protein Cmr1
VKELPFTLRLNTPAFMGAAQHGTRRVEFKKKNRDGVWEDRHESVPFYPVDPGGIRVPSLRGILSFWHRSLLSHLEPQEVFSRQAALFGSTNRGQGIRVRWLEARFQSGEVRYGRTENLFEHVYLGYGPIQLLKVEDRSHPSGRQDIATSFNSNACREAILADRLRPEFHFAAQGTPAQIDGLKRALLLLHLFGGIGARSRRGWGSVEVEIEGKKVARISSVADLSSYLSRSLAEVLPAGDPLLNMRPRPRFTAFSSETKLFLTREFASSDEVLVEFAQRLLDERSYRRPAPRAKSDHDLEFKDFSGLAADTITGIPSRLAFGMPYHPKHPGSWEMEYVGRLPAGDTSDTTRRSSPLLLKVFRLAEARYVGVALLLKADFFGDPRREIGAKGRSLTVPFGTREYDVVDEFLAKTGWTAV